MSSKKMVRIETLPIELRRRPREDLSCLSSFSSTPLLLLLPPSLHAPARPVLGPLGPRVCC